MSWHRLERRAHARIGQRAELAAGAPDFTQHYRTLQDDLSVWAALQVRPPLRQRLDPEDLAQEIWSRAYRDFARFDADRGAFRNWLFGIAYNVLRKQLRTYHRRARIDGARAAEAPEPLDPRTSVGSRLVRSERAALLLRRVEALADADRELVLYRGIEGLSHADVARRLGLTETAAETRWRRLRERLAAWDELAP